MAKSSQLLWNIDVGSFIDSTPPRFRRGMYSIIGVPSASEPSFNHIRSDPKLFTNIYDWAAHSIYGQHCGIPCVSVLLRSGRPSYIIREISHVIINTIKRMLLRWTISDIGKNPVPELSEVVYPLRVYFNPAKIIIFGYLRRRGTSALHITPSSIDNCYFISVGLTMRAIDATKHFFVKTATAICVFAKLMSSNDNASSAITPTKPCRIILRGRAAHELDDDKPSVSFAIMVFNKRRELHAANNEMLYNEEVNNNG